MRSPYSPMIACAAPGCSGVTRLRSTVWCRAHRREIERSRRPVKAPGKPASRPAARPRKPRPALASIWLIHALLDALCDNPRLAMEGEGKALADLLRTGRPIRASRAAAFLAHAPKLEVLREEVNKKPTRRGRA